MDTNTEELKTPNNKLRSLGLRRSRQKSIAAKTPLSDVKISYKSLQTQSETDVSLPLTPRLCQTQTVTEASSACSKNCLPYRLSLNRTAREKYKKKKLEFAATLLDLDSLSDMQQEVANKEKLLQRHEKHKEKVKELKSVIAIWTEAFKTSLEELSSKIEPKMPTEDLIARLGIPPDMIDNT